MHDSSKNVKSQGCAFFGIIKLKFNVKSLFIPQNHQNLAQNGTFFHRKCLAVRMLMCKLPLIIIVAP